MFVTINNHLLQWKNLSGASTEVCEQETPTNQMTNYSFPLDNVETLLLVFHRITTWYLSNFPVSCMHLHLTDFSICKWTFSCGCILNYKHSKARSQLNFVTNSNLLRIQRMLTVRNLFSSLPIVPALYKTLLSSWSIRFLGMKGAQRWKISHVWAGMFGPNWKKG